MELLQGAGRDETPESAPVAIPVCDPMKEIIAAIMALGRLDVNGGLPESAYTTRGIRVI